MFKTFSKASASFVLLSALFQLQLPAYADAFTDMGAAFSQGEFARTIAGYEQLPPAQRNLPMPLFWTGNSYMRRHNYKQAQIYLQKAVDAGLPPARAEVATDILTRIQTLSQLCPPFYKSYEADGYKINLYVQNGAWGNSIAAQMPVFLARAKEAFGSNSPTDISFYLFEERAPYDKFFGAWTKRGAEEPEAKHRGTGSTDLVEFCQYYPTGIKIGAGNINDMFARLLHEYSHSLCHTIYGDNFPRNCPQWLNEGMADYFGWKYRPEMYAQQRQALIKVAASLPVAPTYEELSKGLYAINGGYTIADVLVMDLLQGRDVSTYKQIISYAQQDGGNFELALRQATGKDPRASYENIVRTYWRQH